jgi:hypothetical protein
LQTKNTSYWREILCAISERAEHSLLLFLLIKNPSNVKKFNWQLVPNLFISTLLILPCCKTKAIAKCFPNCQSVNKDALGKFKGLSQVIR